MIVCVFVCHVFVSFFFALSFPQDERWRCVQCNPEYNQSSIELSLVEAVERSRLDSVHVSILTLERLFIDQLTDYWKEEGISGYSIAFSFPQIPSESLRRCSSKKCLSTVEAMM